MCLQEIPHYEVVADSALAGGSPRWLSSVPTLPLPTRIAFIGNYLPRQCGIATFTTDLCTAVGTEFGVEHRSQGIVVTVAEGRVAVMPHDSRPFPFVSLGPSAEQI